VPAYLEVIGDDHTEMVALDGARVTVGRGSSNDVALRDKTASRRHAVFEKLAAGWSVTDVGSTNGTMVNGQYVDQPRPLFSGDEITIGDTRLIYHSGDIR
jgi:pSer/pThr/pTyr-binding forkhead associated (FHA) protein